ncbi:ricin-type beta-trefoil lectin domain protein [Streptomyces sp. NBC_01497]|uniref:ricin-type beta-trefoil lectin domain protein n=1 Tax=Streptomyces sp. NBC_01497 TaxID=2903885 RepID=UPI003FCEA18C
MSPASNTDGTPVVIAPCNGSTTQRWLTNADGSISQTSSGKCLTPSGGATADTTPVLPGHTPRSPSVTRRSSPTSRQ